MTIQRLYSELKQNYAERVGLESIPPEYRSAIVCVGGSSEQQEVLRQLLATQSSCKSVLVIGVSGGRDFWYLKAIGYEVEGLDLVQPEGYPKVHIANIEQAEQLPPRQYDAIVMNEVLEHLRDDSVGLRNVASLLAPDGRLILSVPFYHDIDPHECHLHIYSPKTLERLFNVSDLRIERKIYRPGPFPTIVRRLINPLHHAVNLLVYKLTKRTIYDKTLPWLWKLYMSMGKRTWPHRPSNMFGVTVIARKAETLDYLQGNIDTYFKEG